MVVVVVQCVARAPCCPLTATFIPTTFTDTTFTKMSNSTSTAVGDGLSAGEIVAFVCMIEWAIIHVAAMFMIGIPAWSDKSPYGAYDALMGVDAYKKEYDAAIRPRLSGKILWQHGFNLGWCGLWAGIAVPLCIYHQNRMAWVMTLVPFLTDIGYFVAFDLFKLMRFSYVHLRVWACGWKDVITHASFAQNVCVSSLISYCFCVMWLQCWT